MLDFTGGMVVGGLILSLKTVKSLSKVNHAYGQRKTSLGDP